MGTGGSAGGRTIAQIGGGAGSSTGRGLARVVDPAASHVSWPPDWALAWRILPSAAGRRLFAAEVLYREMDSNYEVIAPAILSSIVAYSTFVPFFGWTPLFETRISLPNSARARTVPRVALVVVCRFVARHPIP